MIVLPGWFELVDAAIGVIDVLGLAQVCLGCTVWLGHVMWFEALGGLFLVVTT